MDENKVTLGFCRACLIKYDDPLELISYNEKNRRLFVYATGLQVKHSDNFVFQLCKNCYSNLKIAAKFKKISRNSDKRFKTFMEMKKQGSNLDFCNYIKNADTSYMFRMRTMDSSSPHKPSADNDKDETASTSTSIRNFMTDILWEEDIPATEAKIISQVIAEEADILEESLDSHWLDDDDMTVNDILDFSFSPFSTPKAKSDERYSPLVDRNDNENKEIIANKYQFDVAIKTKILDMAINDSSCLVNDEVESNIKTMLADSNKTEVNNIYLDSQSSVAMKTIHIKDQSQGIPNKCVIDKNLAIALKNDDVLISLDDLLNTPKAVIDIPDDPPTPLINKLLFAEENSQSTPDYIRDLDKPIPPDFDKYQDFNFDPDEILNKLNKGTANQSKETKCNYYVERTIEEDLPNDELPTYDISMDEDVPTENIDDKTKDSPEEKVPTEESFDIENNSCKLCKIKFKAVQGLKIHSKRKHNYQLPLAGQSIRNPKYFMICDHCNKEMFTYRAAFVRHLQSHDRKIEKKYECKSCLSVFDKASHLKMHSYHHMSQEERDKARRERRKYICPHCGAGSTTAATLRLHILRHTNNYKFVCSICDKRFPRNHDLNVHMRYHTNVTPYTCQNCNMSFKRRDELTRHLAKHYSKFKCDTCESYFPNETAYQKHITRKRKCKNKNNVKIKTKKNGDYLTKTKIMDDLNRPVLDIITKDGSDDREDLYLLYVE